MDRTLALQCVKGNPRAELTAAQDFLQPHADIMIMLWWGVWGITLAYLIGRIVREWMRS